MMVFMPQTMRLFQALMSEYRTEGNLAVLEVIRLDLKASSHSYKANMLRADITIFPQS